MEPKDKAKELIGKFREASRKYKTANPLFSERQQMKMCALICVDELLILSRSMDGEDYISTYTYYQKVKQEIEKL